MKPNAAKLTDSIAIEAPSRGPVTIATRRIGLVAEVAEPPKNRHATQPIWEPTLCTSGALPTTSEVLAATRPPEQLPADLEASIVGTLGRPLRPDEGHQNGNDNRERELRTLFAELTPIQALHLRRRLDLDRNDDLLAVAFRRLVVDRRQRLRTFLADPRRQVSRATR